MRKTLLLGLAVALVIILLLFDSKPVTTAVVSPPNPATIKAPLVPETTDQVIVVTTDQWSENKAQVAAFEREGALWRKVGGDFSARIARNGFSDGAGTRSDVTPSGAFSLTTSFGAVPNPGTKIPYRTVDASDCWVTAADSPYFDQWVTTPACPEEVGIQLREANPGPLELAIVTSHEAAGDAALPRPLFLRRYDYSAGKAPLPTNGDVSMRREDLLDLLLWLDPEKVPVVVLGVDAWLTGNDPGGDVWKDLRREDIGEVVKQVQRALTDHGIPTVEDGLFLDQTERNVRTFQEQNDLPVSGVVDTSTARRLGVYDG